MCGIRSGKNRFVDDRGVVRVEVESMTEEEGKECLVKVLVVERSVE